MTMQELREIEQISREENFLIESLVENMKSDLFETSIDSDLILELEELSSRQIEFARRINGIDGSGIERLIAFKSLIKKERKVNNMFKKDFSQFMTKLNNLNKKDMSEEVFVEEANHKMSEIINKIKKLEPAFEKDLDEINLKLEEKAEQELSERFDSSLDELKNRPYFYIELNVLNKLRKYSTQAIKNKRETGGFFHYERKSKGFLLDSFFYESNKLNEINLSEINSIEKVKKVYKKYLGVSNREFEKSIDKGVSFEEFKENLREKKNTAYKSSDSFLQMLDKKYGKENIITWHVHPPGYENNSAQTKSYMVSESDMNHHEKHKGRISDFYYEILVHDYKGNENPNSSFLIPNRWSEKTEDSIQRLPVWITQNKRPISAKKFEKEFPILAEYNKSLIRALAAGKEKRWPYFIDDDIQRLGDTLNRANIEDNYLLETREAFEIFTKRKIDLKKLNI